MPRQPYVAAQPEQDYAEFYAEEHPNTGPPSHGQPSQGQPSHGQPGRGPTPRAR